MWVLEVSLVLLLTTVHVRGRGVPSLNGSDTAPGPGVVWSSPPTKTERVDQVVQGNSREVLETQHAVCEVNTEELAAKAQATVTRVLKGLCNAKEMEERFQSLEKQLSEQLNELKAMIMNMDDRLQEQDYNARRAHRRILNSVQRCGVVGVASNGKTHWSGGNVRSAADSTSWDAEVDAGDSSEWDAPPEAPRSEEIRRYNSSIHTLSSGQRVFTYYWRVHHVSQLLKDWSTAKSVRSPSFYVFQGGYRMFLRVYPRREGGNMYVAAGLTPGAHDHQLPWPFALKLRLSVLEQAAAASEDMTSRLWDARELCSHFNWQQPVDSDSYECVGLGFPHSTILSRRYLWRDSALFKLSVVLS